MIVIIELGHEGMNLGLETWCMPSTSEQEDVNWPRSHEIALLQESRQVQQQLFEDLKHRVGRPRHEILMLAQHICM